MIIYNVTVKIDLDIHDEWLHYMKHVHIPEVMLTGKFEDSKIMRLMEENSSEGITYAIQYRCQSMSDYLDYQENHAEALQKDHSEKYKGKFVAFRTLLKEV